MTIPFTIPPIRHDALERARKALMLGGSLREAAELIDVDTEQLDVNLWRRLTRMADRGDIRRHA